MFMQIFSLLIKICDDHHIALVSYHFISLWCWGLHVGNIQQSSLLPLLLLSWLLTTSLKAITHWIRIWNHRLAWRGVPILWGHILTRTPCDFVQKRRDQGLEVGVGVPIRFWIRPHFSPLFPTFSFFPTLFSIVLFDIVLHSISCTHFVLFLFFYF